jgi:hypothetical protein
LQLPDVAAGSGPPDRTCVIHHRTDELLVEQHTVSDGQAVSHVKEGEDLPLRVDGSITNASLTIYEA